MDTQSLHRDAIIFDGHCDTLLEIQEGNWKLGERSERGHVDLPRLTEGGVTAQIFALYIAPEYLPARATWQALRLIDLFQREAEANADRLLLATRAADIEEAKRRGKVAGVLGLEGAEALEGDLGVLRLLYQLGLRNVGITWNFRNQAADGLGEKRTGGGLTEFGVKLIEELNRLGVMVDVAHLAPAGVRDVLAISQGPVVASHANAYAVCPHQRNLTDEQLEGIARSGGVVGVTFVASFVAEDKEQATLAKLLDHVDHIVKVAGIDHVGLGSDFDGYEEGVREIKDAASLPLITLGMAERGYSEEDIRKFLGGNWLRVFRQIVG
ncbi:MAG: membrane dipeptidase [Chloroflexi bacterium]|nr:membrane dipeptidase [Chloroflexota bacterium]